MKPEEASHPLSVIAEAFAIGYMKALVQAVESN